MHVLSYGRAPDEAPAPDGAVLLAPPSITGPPLRRAAAALRFLLELRSTGYGEALVAQPALYLSRGRGALVAFPFLAGVDTVRALDPPTGSTTRPLRRRVAVADFVRFLVLAAGSRILARLAAEAVRVLDALWKKPRFGTVHGDGGEAVYLRTDVELALNPLLVGGSQTHTDGILGALERRGYKVELWSTGEIAGRAESLPGGRLPALLAGNVPREISELLAGVVQFRRLAGREPPTFVYQRYSLNNLAGVALATRWRVPLILEANASETKWRGDWSTLSFPPLAEATERLVLRRAARIAAVSENAARDLVQAGAPRDRLCVIPNGVEVDRFADREAVELPFPRDSFVVCFAGLFYPWHGVGVLAEAFAVLRAQRPEARLVLVGDGEGRTLVESILDSAGVRDDALLTGLVSRDEVPGFLAAADALASPHLPNDTFIGSPIKLWEYMASGRAIVASDTAQLGQVLRDGETALVVPAGDPAALAAALIRLADSRELRVCLGQAAQREARAEHSWHARLAATLA